MQSQATSGPAKNSARDRILLAAHDLYYGDGVRATGVDRVIAEAGVTKVTFYRHFPSKNELILAFLEYRHERWMAWFTDSLQRHARSGASDGVDAVVGAMGEWFRSDGFRGCAFINTVGELGAANPEVVAIAARHKQDMTHAIAALLPPSRHRDKDAQAAAMAVDGAIIRAQMDATPDAALKTLRTLLVASLGPRH
jgi:AcrR family transcriptional regulator